MKPSSVLAIIEGAGSWNVERASVFRVLVFDDHSPLHLPLSVDFLNLRRNHVCRSGTNYISSNIEKFEIFFISITTELK